MTFDRYGCEKLNTLERKMLRRIFGQVVEQVMWRKRTAQEFRELYKDIDIVADIKGKRLEWTENLVRMDHGMAIKRMFESKPE